MRGGQHQWRWMVRTAALALGLAALGGCGRSTPATPPLQVELTHVVGEQPLRLDHSVYRTAAGDEFQVSRLRYYLSNFRLHRADGSWYSVPRDAKTSSGYFLIDETDAASKTFSIAAVPAGAYDGIEFLIGVDAERNHAGAQSGTLDPARGLFWTWKSGYIFFLLEGRSAQSGAPDQTLKFHVGGDAPPTARSVYLPLPEAARVDLRTAPVLHLHVDLAELFAGKTPLRFADTHTLMGGGPETAALADRLPGVFRVDHVHNEAHAPTPP